LFSIAKRSSFTVAQLTRLISDPEEGLQRPGVNAIKLFFTSSLTALQNKLDRSLLVFLASFNKGRESTINRVLWQHLSQLKASAFFSLEKH
jgi:hypothetical protein